jgi:hypothetical protein
MRYRLRTLLGILPGGVQLPGYRTWLRFSLRTALIVVTLLCIWLAAESSRARRQQNAIATLQQLGGRIGFDYQLERPGKWKSKPNPVGPEWLRRAIGDDFFRRVVIVNFDEGSDPADRDLAVLRELPGLLELTLMNRTRITDEGLRNLSGLRQLKVLALNGTKIDGSGLGHVPFPRRIEGLALSDAPVTDEALMHIEQMTNLKWLILTNTKITDRGMSHLAALKSLEDLQIEGTVVTDEGLGYLKAMTSLKRVLLGDTQTTANGRAGLRQALPNCRVSD